MKNLLTIGCLLASTLAAKSHAAPITDPERLSSLVLRCDSSEGALYVFSRFGVNRPCIVERIHQGNSEKTTVGKCNFPVSTNHFTFWGGSGGTGAEMYGKVEFVETTQTYQGWLRIGTSESQWPLENVSCRMSQ